MAIDSLSGLLPELTPAQEAIILHHIYSAMETANQEIVQQENKAKKARRKRQRLNPPTNPSSSQTPMLPSTPASQPNFLPVDHVASATFYGQPSPGAMAPPPRPGNLYRTPPHISPSNENPGLEARNDPRPLASSAGDHSSLASPADMGMYSDELMLQELIGEQYGQNYDSSSNASSENYEFSNSHPSSGYQ
jgi:hypothetical protein